MTKLAISEEREEDKYEHVLVIKCWKCDAAQGAEIPSASAEPKVVFPPYNCEFTLMPINNAQVRALVEGIMQSMSSARQSEVQAWEEEILPCEHTLTLDQLATGHIPASGNCIFTR
jgi:ubiquitin carboxyl-terminal hydrolase 5/13